MAGGDLADLAESRDVLTSLSVGHRPRLARSTDGFGNARPTGTRPARAVWLAAGPPSRGAVSVRVGRSGAIVRWAGPSKPPAFGEPAAQGAVRRQHRNDDRSAPHAGDHDAGIFAGGKPRLDLVAQVRPCVTPRQIARRRCGSDPPFVVRKCSPAPWGLGAPRSPRRREVIDQSPAPPHSVGAATFGALRTGERSPHASGIASRSHRIPVPNKSRTIRGRSLLAHTSVVRRRSSRDPS